MIKRFDTNPLIVPDMDERIGSNINGPSLIQVPNWIANPLGRYYLYFAHHQGRYIRLAYADEVQGPWRIHIPGALELEDSFFKGHIASPDVHVRHDRQEIWMYYHGCCLPQPPSQVTRLAVSTDGLHFEAEAPILGRSYWRVFEWDGWYYTLEMPGRLRRSRDGRTHWEQGPLLFTPDMRHCAVRLVEQRLQVFYSNAGDCPERILRAEIDLRPDWNQWQTTPPVTVLEPEIEYEGAKLPLEASSRGAIHTSARQLRDPCIFSADGRTYLLYSVAGEFGIAGAQISEN